MRPHSDPNALHARTAAEAEALVTSVNDEISRSFAALTKEFEGLASKADVEALQHKLREREAETEQLKTQLVKVLRDLESAKAELAGARQNIETTRADGARMAREFERALDEIRREHAAVLAEQTAAYTALPLDELLTVFRAMGKAATTPELMGALLTGLAREFSRVALFHLDGARLIAAERRGFSDEDTSKSIRLPADSLLRRAVSTGRLETLIQDAGMHSSVGLPFGGTPRCALALPIVENGELVAVIYADDSHHMESGSGASQARVKFAELVHHYAALVMLRISVEEIGSQDLRGFAAELVAELEYNYTVETEAGRNRLECQQHLKTGLQTARRRYVQRAGDDVEAAGLLNEQIAATLAARRESAFGRDLEALVESARARGGRRNVVAINRSR